MKKFALLLLILMIAVCVLCLTFCSGKAADLSFGDYRYTVQNGEVTITEYNGDSAEVIIPESIKGMPVVTIETSAFHNCEKIKTLVIPDSVEKIESWAFSKCYSLENVTLGNGVRIIDSSPFAYCDKIVYNEYENGLYLGNEENPYLALVTTTSEHIDRITIHPDTVIICGSAMKSCYLLRELVIPEGVVSLGSSAFAYASGLEKIYIPKSVEYIGSMAFRSCDSIKEITVADENPNFKSVDGSLFSRDGSTLIKYAVGKDNAVYSVPDGTVVIEDNAFENAKYLTEVALPDSVETLCHSAFLRCENLKKVDLGNVLKEIGGCAFSSCTSLTEIIIPDSVKTVAYHAFSYCNKLERAVIGSGTGNVEFGAFSGCTSLKEVIFKNTDGWKVQAKHGIFPRKVDVTDPKKNVENLTGAYREYYWTK